jgi:hypothetical protein
MRLYLVILELTIGTDSGWAIHINGINPRTVNSNLTKSPNCSYTELGLPNAVRMQLFLDEISTANCAISIKEPRCITHYLSDVPW